LAEGFNENLALFEVPKRLCLWSALRIGIVGVVMQIVL